MKNKLLTFLVAMPIFGFSQVGINTKSPKTTLHIDATSKTTPVTTDGILIPKFKDFPKENPTVRGMLAFLEGNETHENNFYFFDGEKWVPFYSNVSKELDETIYSFNGQGANFTTAGRAGTLKFSQFNKRTEDGFAIQGDDTIKIGKKGLYFVQLSSSFRRAKTTANGQSNMNYTIMHNGAEKANGSIGYPLEGAGSTGITGSSIVFGTVLELQEGDTLQVKFNGTKPTNANQTYTPFGINNLTLTYIHD